MVFEFLSQLKSETTESQFKEILKATEQDIKFNRVSFGKITSPIDFIEICTRCACLIMRLGGCDEINMEKSLDCTHQVDEIVRLVMKENYSVSQAIKIVKEKATKNPDQNVPSSITKNSSKL